MFLVITHKFQWITLGISLASKNLFFRLKFRNLKVANSAVGIFSKMLVSWGLFVSRTKRSVDKINLIVDSLFKNVDKLPKICGYPVDKSPFLGHFLRCRIAKNGNMTFICKITHFLNVAFGAVVFA